MECLVMIFPRAFHNHGGTMKGWCPKLIRKGWVMEGDFRKNLVGVYGSLCGILIMILTGIALFSFLERDAQARTTVHISADAGQTQLKGLDERGDIQFTLPLYQQNGIRYFSAGVGIEERQGLYPAYPLKIVLVSGPRTYLSSVTISIQAQNGSKILDIPPDQVGGPWLFINLPPGTYFIIGSSGKAPVVKRAVTLTKSKTTQVILRWPAGE